MTRETLAETMTPSRKLYFKFIENVLKYAEENSGEEAAKHFDTDPRRIRYWKAQKNELLLANKARASLAGAGRTKVSLELETRLTEWIYSACDRHNRVSWKMIQKKSLEIFARCKREALYSQQRLVKWVSCMQWVITETSHHHVPKRPRPSH